MNLLHCRLLQRAVAAFASATLVASGLAGCATKPSAYAQIDGVVVDGQRLAAGPGEYGLVSVTRDGKTVEARAGMELRRGDRVATGPRAEAVIRYASGSELLMRPNSSGRIGSFLDTVGEVFAKIRGKFEVETTFVRAGAQGTAYLVRTAQNGETTVIVFDGTVRVDSIQGAWRPVTIGAGQMTLAHPRAPQPMLASEAELQATRTWVERLERLVPAPKSSASGAEVAAVAAVAVAVGAILASRSRSRDSAPPPSPEPAGASRAGTTDTATAGKAATDAKKAQEAAPRALGTPTGLEPNLPQAGGRRLDCRNSVALKWRAVDGARDYLVQFEKLDDKSKQWRAAPPTATAGLQATMSSSQLGSSNRWSVRARDGNRIGSPSALAYFDCDFVVVR